MASATLLLANQVGGHPGVRSSADGSQILKPCLPTERAFYEKVITTNAKGFHALHKHVPTFYGVSPAEVPEGKDEFRFTAIILENLSHPFTHPSILDIKLGTVLYDDSASPEKKERMIKAAKDTTSLETGMRFTGFTVYDTTTQKFINTGKEYGRVLSAAKLPEAMARFFPIQTPILSLSTPTPTEEGGHTDITPSPAGTPPDLLLPVLQGILYSTRQLRDAIAQTEMRMVGGSMLIIYEGDLERLKAALEEGEEQGPAFAVKLIDFAHTKLEEGLGPDKGVVLGLHTTISLLEGRIKEVQEAMGSA